MSPFLTLWRGHTEFVPGQRFVDRRGEVFPAVVAGSEVFREWTPGDSFPKDGVRALVGVATWSGYDMLLLDRLADQLRVGRPPARVDVFDVDRCRSGHDFEQYVPGVRDVVQTPVVGIWLGGRLLDAATGANGRQLLDKYLGFDLGRFDEQVRGLHVRKT